MTVEALIFDVDGVLADTEDAHRTAFNAAFDHHALGWSWDRACYRRLLAVTGGKERIAGWISQLDVPSAERQQLLALIPAIHAEKTCHYTTLIRDGGVPLREGIARLIDEAIDGGCRVAIASTTTPENVDALLTATLGPHGPDRFTVIACGDQVRAKKPAPDIYELVLTTLGVAPQQAIAFEDSANGLRAALGAGLWTVVTPTYWTDGDDFRGAGLQLPHLGDPACPIEGEPGNRLALEGWLTFDELCRRAQPRPMTPTASWATHGTVS